VTLLAVASGCNGDPALHLSVFQAAVLGLTQGLSEFLPISSSGHLILVPWLAHWPGVYCAKEGNKFFDVALHIGTFVGATAYLRRELWSLVRAWFASLRARAVRTPEERLGWYLVLSAIPAALLGALLEGPITRTLGQPWQIAVFLAIFGVALYVVDKVCEERTSYRDLNTRQATAMAVGQALALAPGVSRSGVTITAARLTGVTRDAAARFSFLMSLPITLGAAAYSGANVLGEPDAFHGQVPQFAVGILFSGVSGALAVWGVLAFLRRRSYAAFAAYRVVIAIVVLLLIVTGTRSATI
jgi:undecaprenyl-diphosphatase